jgi:methionine-rich copper-binding protein CopC
MTNDETWEAYNNFGGYSLYNGNASGTASSRENAGRAVQVSYNRPLSRTVGAGTTEPSSQLFFNWDFPMIRFMEKNGFDVSYVSQTDVAASGGAAMLEQHKAFMEDGHSEYWDAASRANVTAARDHGVSLAFFSGNTMWWKTRLAASQYGNEATLICYKESIDSAQTDPADPPTWTGSWRDPRFSPPGDGQPENALTGQLWLVNANSGSTFALQVSSAFSKLRFWRNTSVASLPSGQTATMPGETLGPEWDVDVDNPFRPAGNIDMSKETHNVSSLLVSNNQDFGSGTATHSLTLYRAASGALVFDAGTMNWSWGLDSDHAGDSNNPPSTDMQQAMVNLFADMGAQPATLQTGLVAATASADHTPPASTISSPSPGATFTNGSTVTISGAATDSGGGVVAGVEVSTDGGSTWHPATTMSPAGASVTWSDTWSATGNGNVTIKSRATDDSGNIETPGPGISVTVNCPCSLFGNNYIPSITSNNDTGAYEFGMKFQSSVAGWVSGVRFYKGTGNNGTHTGSLWTSSGTQLATGTFTNETTSGWQTLTFASAVFITANTTYVVSYYDPNGHYSSDTALFDWPLKTPPLTAVKSDYIDAGGGNGVFNPGSHGFPTTSFSASSYAVDVIFSTSPPAGIVPSVTAATPAAGSSSNPTSTDPSVTFSEPVVPSSVSFAVKDASGTAVAGSVSFDSTNSVATFTPTAALAAGTTYTVTVSGAKDSSGNAMTSAYTYSFTTSRAFGSGGQCPCAIWPDTAPAGAVDSTDTSSVELGVKFTPASNGTITGVRFYKEPDNTGSHTGTLWTAGGSQLATGTFASESTQGWQELDFQTPVAVTAGTTYVASYHTTVGHYANSPNGLASAVTNGPLTAVASGGVFGYGSSTTFPSTSYQASNYWVDVVYTAAPVVTSTTPGNSATSVPVSTSVTATFNKPIQAGTAAFSLTDPNGNTVAGTTSLDSSGTVLTFTPNAQLSQATVYKVTVNGAISTTGAAMAAPVKWSFTTSGTTACPCTIWESDATPSIASASDTGSVELGVKFQADTNGWITGIRFYKGANNTGTHVGSLWDSSGHLLSQVTFANESAAGWQQANFSSPIQVTAGTTYVASYLAPKGGYSASPAAFASAGVDNSPLHAPSSPASGGNGVYLYTSSPAFPTNTYNATNYWVDVIFTTTAP